jgi:predicted ATPase
VANEDQIEAVLGNRRALVMPDNVERVLETEPLVGDLLGACPSVTALVTGRIVRRVSGEQAVAEPPLALPDAEVSPGIEP